MSAVMQEQSSNDVAEFFSPGPGERLRSARLAKEIDLVKIASELHLTRQVVESLEADDYSDVGVRVFVRGYLRNYARIVDLPVETILRQFDEKWPDEGGHGTVVRQSPMLPADGGPGRGWAGAVTWLLILGSVVLFLVWWRGYLGGVMPGEDRATAAADPAALASGAATAAPGALTLDVDPAPDGGLSLPAPALPSAAPPSPERPPQPAGLYAIGALDPDETLVAIETTMAVAPPASVPPAPTVTPVTSSPVPAGSGAGAPADAGAGAGEIVMTFSGACWVDVRDSERKFKLFGEMPKGTRKVLGGEPPYKMVIGNARVVTISVDGRPFDLARHAKGNVARFTLDP